MARPKKVIKVKEPVKIRQKQLKDGNVSLYLDIYYRGKRKYEFLEMYLVPVQSPSDKLKNEETMRRAEKIKSERILQIQSYGIDKFEQIKKSDMLLTDWLREYCKEEGFKKSTINSREKTLMHLEIYLQRTNQEFIRLSEVNKDFCRGFVGYLRTADNKALKSEERAGTETLAQNTAHGYQATMIAALNKAIKEGLISKNPFDLLTAKEKIPMAESDREFLTIDELRRLSQTRCHNEMVKKAFMFSCFTGLRLSDIRKLTRLNIRESVDGTGTYIDTNMVKTGKKVTVPLSQEALQWLPETESLDKPFFKLPTSKTAIGIHIKNWCKDAEIDKHITFHCARHTFGTMMLTLGADLYTTSKLMGHSNVATTTIYAKIIDQKKVDSIHLLDNLFSSLSEERTLPEPE